MTTDLRCMLCRRPIARLLPTGEPVGPTCARNTGLLPPITRRAVPKLGGGRALRFIGQADWVDEIEKPTNPQG